MDVALEFLVCSAVFDRIPLAQENLVENVPLAKDHFPVTKPFLCRILYQIFQN